MSTETLVILGSLFLYMLFMLWIGYRVSRTVTGVNDYILAGRNLPWFVLTLTFLASAASTAQVMGQPGFSYQTGLSFLFWNVLAVVTLSAILLPRIGARLRGLGLSTVADFAGIRFRGSRRLHYLMLAWQVTWGVFVTAISLFGAALLIKVVTGIPWQVAIVIIAVVTIIYTAMGGLRAVAITDAVQWMIIIVGTAVFIPLIFYQSGSFTSFFSKYLGSSGLSPTAAASETALNPGFTDIFTLPPGLDYLPLLLAFVLSSLWIPVDLSFVQRMLAARNIYEGRKGTYVFLGMQFFITVILLVLGMYGRALIPNLANQDEIIVVLARDTLPLIGAGLFVAAVAAAAQSTISTYLNACSSLIVRNLLVELRPSISEARQLLLTRVFTVVVCLAALSFAPFISATGIIAAAIAVQIVVVTSLVPIIILGVFWRRLTERAAFWGCSVTSVATFVLVVLAGGPSVAIASPGFFGIPVIFWGFAVGAVFFVGFSLLEPYRPESMSPGFRDIFEGRAERLPRTDLKILGGLWVALTLLIAYKRTIGSEAVFPPLSGPLAWLTDGFFLASAVGVLIASIFLLVKLYGYIREEVSVTRDTPKEDAAAAAASVEAKSSGSKS